METTAKNSFVVKAVSIWLSFVMILTSFSGYSTSRTPLPSKTVAQHTGEEYFRAIFFKQGDMAAKIYKGQLEEITSTNYSDRERTEVAAIQNMVIRDLIAANPKYMSELKTAVESNDLNSIEAAVSKGGNLIGQTLEKINPESLKDNSVYERFLSVAKGETTADKSACVIFYLAPFLYFQVVVWYAVSMPFLIVASAFEKDKQSDLYKEQFIYNIYEL